MIALDVIVRRLACVAIHAAVSGPMLTNGAEIPALRSEIEAHLSNGAQPVIPAPALCAAKSPAQSFYDYYFSSTQCENKVLFPAQPNALMTPLSRGDLAGFFWDSDKRRRLIQLLEQVPRAISSVASPNLPSILRLQSLLWEMLFGLEINRHVVTADEARHLDDVIAAVRDALRATLFSFDQLKTLSVLPSGAGECEACPGVNRILLDLKESNDYLEIADKTTFHAQMFVGRFATRVFLGFPSPKTREAVGDLLRNAVGVSIEGVDWGRRSGLPSQRKEDVELRDLLKRFPDARLVLLAYFNSLDKDLRIQPTPIVAFLETYSVNGTLPESATFEDAAPRLEFGLTEYVTTGMRVDEEPTYSEKSQGSVARLTSPNTIPVTGGERATTLRGSCLRCHSTAVASLSRLQRSHVTFTRPFARSADALIGSVPYDEIRSRLQRWLLPKRSEQRPFHIGLIRRGLEGTSS